MRSSALSQFLQRKKPFIIVGFFVFIGIFSFISIHALTKAQAQTTQNYPVTSYTTPNVNPDVPQDQHTYVQSVFLEVMAATMCQLAGIDMINPQQGCLGVNLTTHKLSYASPDESQPKVGGLLGFSAQMIGGLYDMPIHSSHFVGYLAQNFGITKSAYAQTGSGFDQLNAILQIWLIFRNLAYLLFTLLFLLVGIAIMLRFKIDPRTTMSIQNQLPKIISGLLFITFSYAISGFVIDAMWALTYLSVNIVGQVNVTKNGVTQPAIKVGDATKDLYLGPVGYANQIYNGGVIGLSGQVGGTVGDVAAVMLSPFSDKADKGCTEGQNLKILGIIDTPIPLDLPSCFRGMVYWGLKIVVGFVASFIIVLALLVALFRIWWALIRSYAYILMYTTIAPIYILAGILPGSTLGFIPWLRGLLANTLVYPTTVLFLLAARVFSESMSDKGYFIPPLTGNPAATGGFGYLAAFSIIMITPELINLLRDTLKSPANKYIAPSITAGAGRGGKIAGAGFSPLSHKLWKINPNTGEGIGTINTALKDRGDEWVNPTKGYGRIKRTLGKGMLFLGGTGH